MAGLELDEKNDESFQQGDSGDEFEIGRRVKPSSIEEKLRRSRICILFIKKAMLDFGEGMHRKEVSWVSLATVCLKDVRRALEDYDSTEPIDEDRVLELLGAVDEESEKGDQ